jgi:hypothetical protein
MKIRAKANGNIVDVPDDDADALLVSGIYEPLDAPSTEVAPLTTTDKPKKKAKAKAT